MKRLTNFQQTKKPRAILASHGKASEFNGVQKHLKNQLGEFELKLTLCLK